MPKKSLLLVGERDMQLVAYGRDEQHVSTQTLDLDQRLVIEHDAIDIQ